MRKTKTEKPAAAPAAGFTKADLTARVLVLTERRKEITAEILMLERAGARLTTAPASVKEKALAMLRGEEVKQAPLGEPESRLASLHTERSTIDLALQFAEQKFSAFDQEEAAERLRLGKPAYDAAMAKICRALVDLEHGMAEADVARRAIKVSWVLPGAGFPLAGRLMDRDSQASRLLNVGVGQGWIEHSEVDRETKRAKEARGKK